MRPPPQRTFVGIAQQLRPPRGVPPGPVPATAAFASSGAYHVHNRDSLMMQACQQGHEKRALPLLDSNRHKGLRLGDYSQHAPQPKLPRRPNVRAPIVVSTWNTP